MGRFPWTPGHSKQGSDKPHGLPQASTGSTKEHSQSLSGGTEGTYSSTRTRSRTNTLASSHSFYARSLSDSSNEHGSRPGSPQSTVDREYPGTERRESTAKALLSKGTRMLKRQGSKLNLLPSQFEDKVINSGTGGTDVDHGDGSPTRPLERQATISSKRGAPLKRSISGPFDFQHVTHTDQGRFQSLDKATKTQLVSEFSALQSEQRPDAEIRGIPVNDLPQRTSSLVDHHHDGHPPSPFSPTGPGLPLTPPRPLPPPKDALRSPYSPSDMRLSRSMENFSRPTRSPVPAQDTSPSAEATGRLAALSPIGRHSVLGKPLPLLPELVHALSTVDDSARPLRSAPLPLPPQPPVLEEEEEEKDENDDDGSTPQANSSSEALSSPPPRASLWHMQTFPVARPAKRRSQSSGQINFDIMYEDVMALTTDAHMRHSRPEVAGPSEKPSHQTTTRVMAAAPVDEWEDAIDYSWDHASEFEDEVEGVNLGRAVSATDLPIQTPASETFLVIEQPGPVEGRATTAASSASSTPLMMDVPPTADVVKTVADQPPSSASGQRETATVNHDDDDASSPLLGLGIDAFPPVPRLDLDDVGTPSCSGSPVQELFSVPAIQRVPNSPMSKSSSQESIILSIASSIMGTHRSSNSSSSMSVVAHLVKFDDPDDSHDDLLSLFPGEGHVREASQETVRERSKLPPIPSIPTPSISATTKMDSPAAVALSPATKHGRTTSVPRIPVPVRKSSVTGVDAAKSQMNRTRANTMNSRVRRNTRASYSLFPSTQPAPPPVSTS